MRRYVGSFPYSSLRTRSRLWLSFRRWLSSSTSSLTAGAMKRGPGLREFMAPGGEPPGAPTHKIFNGDQTLLAPYLKEKQLAGNGRKGNFVTGKNSLQIIIMTEYPIWLVGVQSSRNAGGIFYCGIMYRKERKRIYPATNYC